MKLKVFVSWSGARSRTLAEVLVRWLPRVIQACEPWMSQQIEKGERWNQEIGEKLAHYDVGIVCVTPENVEAPWLLFESGALSKAFGKSQVCPLLLGMRANDLTGPLAQFQATAVDKEDLLRLLESLNGRPREKLIDKALLRETFEREWPELERRIEEVAEAPVPATVESVPSVIRSFAKRGFPEPALGSAAHFTSGFESHGLYGTVCDLATRRLNVFGRKNRKLFDKEHSDFFTTLKAKIDDGFDFRCLFLDPKSPAHVIAAAHQSDEFTTELCQCIEQACGVLTEVDLDPRDHFRTYCVQRGVSLLMVDDAVLYSRIKTTADGRARALTKCPFTVVGSASALGMDLEEDFEQVWEAATPIASR
jgi:hypothetical protein